MQNKATLIILIHLAFLFLMVRLDDPSFLLQIDSMNVNLEGAILAVLWLCRLWSNIFFLQRKGHDFWKFICLWLFLRHLFISICKISYHCLSNLFVRNASAYSIWFNWCIQKLIRPSFLPYANELGCTTEFIPNCIGLHAVPRHPSIHGEEN